MAWFCLFVILESNDSSYHQFMRISGLALNGRRIFGLKGTSNY